MRGTKRRQNTVITPLFPRGERVTDTPKTSFIMPGLKTPQTGSPLIERLRSWILGTPQEAPSGGLVGYLFHGRPGGWL
jgi:hypothetical protein